MTEIKHASLLFQVENLTNQLPSKFKRFLCDKRSSLLTMEGKKGFIRLVTSCLNRDQTTHPSTYPGSISLVAPVAYTIKCHSDHFCQFLSLANSQLDLLRVV
jgi:hypothetical protein